MSKIYLRREHDLTPKAARRKVERVADVLAKRFNAACEWNGDALSVTHPNISGQVVVGKNDVVVEAKLGFLLAMFRDRIDEELVQILDKEFPQAKA